MSARCRWQTAVLAYHEGSLSPLKSTHLEQHLQRCESCARELAQLEATDALLSRYRPQVAQLDPEQAQQLFRAALTASGVTTQPLRPGGWRWKWQAVCLALVVAGSGALAFQLRGRSQLGTVAARTEAPDTVTAFVARRVGPELPAPGMEVERPQEFLTNWRPRTRHRLRSSRRVARRWKGPTSQPVVTPTNVPMTLTADQPEVLEPQLIVSVTRSQPVFSLTVTRATTDAPGLARAEALELTPAGRQVVTAVTVSTCAPESHDAAPVQEQTPSSLEDQEERGDEIR